MNATAARPPAEIGPGLRRLMLIGGGAVGVLSAVAVARGLSGLAPSHLSPKEVAVIVHIAAVLPAVPLGLYILLTRKGGARHRLLGRVWMLLMLTTALSALFIRHINHGQFSWIHLFVPLAIVTMVRAIAAARQGRIGDHKRHMAGMYLGALILPGLFTFLPGRLMWMWLVG
ncbi:MAG: DUF2306 domain-containing protein [Pseudomonadota bacterium]